MKLNKLTKLALILLSQLPFARIAYAAEAKIDELQTEQQQTTLRLMLIEARSRVLPLGATDTTLEAARVLHSQRTGLSGIELERSLIQDLETLQGAGLVRFDSARIVTGGPSEHAF